MFKSASNSLGIQSNLCSSVVTFQGNIEIGSHKTGGHFTQVSLTRSLLQMEIKIIVTQYKLLCNRGGRYTRFDCIYLILLINDSIINKVVQRCRVIYGYLLAGAYIVQCAQTIFVMTKHSPDQYNSMSIEHTCYDKTSHHCVGAQNIHVMTRLPTIVSVHRTNFL